MIKKTMIVLSVVFLLVTGYVFRQIGTQRTEGQAEYQQINAELSQLEEQRSELTKRIDELEDKLGYRTQKTASDAYFCFTAADDRLSDEIFPFMLERDIPGLIILRNNYTIGERAFLNEERVEALEEAGWEFAIGPGSMMEFAGDESDIERFRAYMTDYLAAQGRAISAVYFDKNQYQPYLDEVIRELGFTTVFYECEKDILEESEILKRIPVLNYRDVEAGGVELQRTLKEIGLRVTINWVEATPERARYDEAAFTDFVNNMVFLRESGILNFPVILSGNESQISAVDELAQLYQQYEEVDQAIQKLYK